MNILKILTPQRRIGNLGEKEAARLLRRKGYKILEQNYTACGAEIDIIARRKSLTVFVEVKTRNVKHLGNEIARPASSVTPEKQRKIIKAAGYYCRRNPADTRWQFDVIEVYTEDSDKGTTVKDIKHLEAAFDLNSAFDQKYNYIRQKEGSNL